MLSTTVNRMTWPTVSGSGTMISPVVLDSIVFRMKICVPAGNREKSKRMSLRSVMPMIRSTYHRRRQVAAVGPDDRERQELAVRCPSWNWNCQTRMFDAASSRNRYCRRWTFRFGQALPLTMTTFDSSSASQYGEEGVRRSPAGSPAPVGEEGPIGDDERDLELALGQREPDRSSGLFGSRMKYAAPTSPANTLSRVIPIAWSW